MRRYDGICAYDAYSGMFDAMNENSTGIRQHSSRLNLGELQLHRSIMRLLEGSYGCLRNPATDKTTDYVSGGHKVTEMLHRHLRVAPMCSELPDLRRGVQLRISSHVLVSGQDVIGYVLSG